MQKQETLDPRKEPKNKQNPGLTFHDIHQPELKSGSKWYYFQRPSNITDEQGNIEDQVFIKTGN